MKNKLVGFWGILMGFSVGYACHRREMAKIEKEKSVQIERYKNLYQIFHKWFLIRNHGKQVSDYFIENNMDHVAIYGYGLAGQNLAQELSENGLTVEYVIDQKTDLASNHIPLYCLGDTLPACSAVIVTAPGFGQIKKLLAAKLSCPIVSLADILEVLHNQIVGGKMGERTS